MPDASKCQQETPHDCSSSGSVHPKNIVVLSDGTGNAGGRTHGTNVWRVREAVEGDAKLAGLIAKQLNDPIAEQSRELEQVIIYEDGVGTSTFQPLQVLGLGFGTGIDRDLERLYARLMQVWNPGDRIYLFGFSRGAFTIRLLALMLYRCGLATRSKLVDGKVRQMRPEEIEQRACEAVGAFKRRHTSAAEKFREKYGWTSDAIQNGMGQRGDTVAAEAWKAVAELRNERNASEFKDRLEGRGRVPIRFVGVWDTVDAVGLPFDNVSQLLLLLMRWVARIPLPRWALSLILLNLARPRPYALHNTHQWKKWGEDDDLHPYIESAYHALALDDERKTFHPVLWLECNSDGKQKKHSADDNSERDTLLSEVEQVWFAGVHANVGGGYPKDHMAYVSLEWMMRHASRHGLVFNVQRLLDYHQKRDELGKLYDPRSGSGVLYRYMPRPVDEICAEVGINGGEIKPTIHESVLL